jgi:hypothetical protein
MAPSWWPAAWRGFCRRPLPADGILDQSFGKGGRVTTDVRGNLSTDEARALAIQPDGNVVVAGTAPGEAASEYPEFALRYD